MLVVSAPFYEAYPWLDFDDDGATLIKVFYFGGDPFVADVHHLVRFEPSEAGSSVALRFQKRRQHGGVVSHYEMSRDLFTWEPADHLREKTTPLNAELEMVEVTLPVSEESLYLRIRLAPEE